MAELFEGGGSRSHPGRSTKVLLLTGPRALYSSPIIGLTALTQPPGSRVLLTGASAGVGEELAYHSARLGSHLVLTAHTGAFLQEVIGNCRKLGAPKVFFIAADMASCEVPERGVQFALDKLGGLDYLVLNHLGAAPAGTRARSAQGISWLMQVNLLLPATDFLALPSLTDSKGSLVVVCSLLLGCVPTSFSSPYSAAKFALDSFFGSPQRELDVQDVNMAITTCPLGLQDLASTKEGVSAVQISHVFYPWRFHVLCLLQAWLPHPRALFIRQELNVTATAAA